MKFLKNLDKKYTKICLYAGVTTILTVLAIIFLYSMRANFMELWDLLVAVLRPLILGCLLCYLLYPIVEWIDTHLQQLVKSKKESFPKHSRRIATLLAMLLILVIIVIIVVLLITTTARGIQNIDVAYLENLFNNTQSDLADLIDKIVAYLEEQGFNVNKLGNYLTNAISGVTGIASTTFFGVIFAVYFLVDGKNIARYWKDAAKQVLPAHTIKIMRDLGYDANRCFSGYIRGQALDALLVGVVTSIIFGIVGIPYAALIGFVTGIGNLIPYVGPILGFAMVVITNLINFDVQNMIIGLIVLAIIMLIDSSMINPKFLANAIHVHPLLVVASLIAGAAIGGVLGMLVSVPSGAFVKLQFEKWIAYRRAQKAEKETQ